ncbi:hypothetical protein GE061_008909 [Apolygus lucorum]|uniref:Uncharacterized protein n=1 Tax=Apolygus lucorum TaxID=248454 RepID=A0A8S9XYQ3_APOLU|nr:hypothetical protein GE061_008909 [Apolygus lucorum]
MCRTVPIHRVELCRVVTILYGELCRTVPIHRVELCRVVTILCGELCCTVSIPVIDLLPLLVTAGAVLAASATPYDEQAPYYPGALTNIIGDTKNGIMESFKLALENVLDDVREFFLHLNETVHNIIKKLFDSLGKVGKELNRKR